VVTFGRNIERVQVFLETRGVTEAEIRSARPREART
jgi:hypothetical protein